MIFPFLRGDARRSVSLRQERVHLRPPRLSDWQVWSELRETSRDFTDWVFACGSAFLESGRPGPARGYLGMVVERRPDFAEGRFRFALALSLLGEHARAKEQLLTGLGLDAYHGGIHYQLGVLKMEEEKWAEAEPFFRRVLELETKNLSARKRLAYVLIWKDDFNGALRLMEETSEMYPLVPVVFTNLALLYMETGQAEKALEALEKASCGLQPARLHEARAATE